MKPHRQLCTALHKAWRKDSSWCVGERHATAHHRFIRGRRWQRREKWGGAGESQGVPLGGRSPQVSQSKETDGKPGVEAFMSKARSREKRKYCLLRDLTVCKRPRTLAHLKLPLYSKNYEILKGYEIEALFVTFLVAVTKYLIWSDLREERFIWPMVCRDTIHHGMEDRAGMCSNCLLLLIVLE